MGDELYDNEDHFSRCHSRWIKRTNRKLNSSEEMPNKWADEQCEACRYYIQLRGLFSSDYGVCSSEKSEFDGMVRFSHDGCDEFDEYVDSGGG